MATRDRGLLFKAGPAAYADIRKRGFAAERIGTIAGASGGAKWLVLSQLDRIMVNHLLPKIAGPVHLIGSSIGAWRFACYAQDEPLAAIERFEEAYLSQTYSEKPDTAEITAKTREILDYVIGETGAEQILQHRRCRLHVMTVRCGRMTTSDWPPLLATGLMLAAASNAVSRRSLGLFFSRALFHDTRDMPPFYNAPGFPLHRIPLTTENLSQVVMASGAIPLVLAGVRDIVGAPAGTYRDGGVIDYHLDLPLSEPDQLALFPHFFDQLIPGWFDKRLRYRRHSDHAIDRTILICPSPEFIAGLPNGKVPDRKDFLNFPPAEREKNWRRVVMECRRLADEMLDVIENNRMAALLEPL
ncbi:MAG: patatin-like phospholipase family protein [Woeseia sp.]|nr:patatin-like phospholipase family protein [Woeseia sp.]NNL55144.1 patatin-like phospholipase family protein [Woeseia sp.]